MEKNRVVGVALLAMEACLLRGWYTAAIPASGPVATQSGKSAAKQEEKVQSQEPGPQRKALAPVVEIQKEDYAEVRKRFRTKLLNGFRKHNLAEHRSAAFVAGNAEEAFAVWRG